jgi:hypothetical protein
MLIFFNECKKIKINQRLNELLKEPLWCNKNFVYKNKPIYFKNWLKSGFMYVCDVVDDNGMRPIEWFQDRLICKNNWLCQYMILKTIIKKSFTNYNFKDIKYENIVHDNSFYKLINNQHVKVCDITSKLIYSILRQEKFQNPLHQNYFGKLFEIPKTAWKYIYEHKIMTIEDKHISDFNYRLLNNLLCNREMLKKWKITDNDLCVYCKTVKENNEHLILKCKNVVHIWDIVQKVVNFDISWKTIAIGFYHEKNAKTLFFNLLTSIIACKIYKYKMYCRLENKEEKPEEICCHIKRVLFFFSKVYKNMLQQSFVNILENITEKL